MFAPTHGPIERRIIEPVLGPRIIEAVAVGVLVGDFVIPVLDGVALAPAPRREGERDAVPVAEPVMERVIVAEAVA